MLSKPNTHLSDTVLNFPKYSHSIMLINPGMYLMFAAFFSCATDRILFFAVCGSCLPNTAELIKPLTYYVGCRKEG